jgi:Mg2+ and Co2+ transporter CorA
MPAPEPLHRPSRPPPSDERPAASAGATAGLRAFLVTADGVVADADLDQAGALMARGELFWIDLVGADETARALWVAALGLDAGDSAWLQRFGQAGRISLDRRRLRAATWLSEGPRPGLTEIHVLGSHRGLLTAWDGEAEALGDARDRFAAALGKLQNSPTAAVAILLQLILSTVHLAINPVDEQLVALQQQLADTPVAVDFAVMSAQMRRLQTVWSDVERYSQAVKSALIGLDAVPGMDARGAEELTSYAEQVEDLESRLKERSEWGAEMLRDYATALAHLQSQQISRLTLVSIIFLPITFLTGFFGMNFTWIEKEIGGPAAFAILGVALPLVSVLGTSLWLARRHLVEHRPTRQDPPLSRKAPAEPRPGR